ncbi:MAG: enoyl-CoA hydratase-related protein [Proteobacteria bacterium]|nr:enoyl-CoA hydratase-related protein [Pseudomonadota bacterium]
MTIPNYQTLTLSVDPRGIAYLTLARPQVHNALDAQLIAELRAAVTWLESQRGVRAVVLSGQGKSFCAGGDLGWMRENMDKSRARRVAETTELALMLRAMNELPMPLIGRINGPAYGGGVGMISVCDIAIGVATASFALTEVRLGLLPANIAPYVVARIGEANARRCMLTARRITAAEAKSSGLLNEVVDAAELDAAVERELADLLQCAPGAVTATKRLIAYVGTHDLPTNMLYTADRLA